MRRQPDAHVRSFESASDKRPISDSKTSVTPRQGLQAKTRLELRGKKGREREALPPRLPSGGAVGLDLDRLRGVFREPHRNTASGWNDAEVGGAELCTQVMFSSLRTENRSMPMGFSAGSRRASGKDEPGTPNVEDR